MCDPVTLTAFTTFVSTNAATIAAVSTVAAGATTAYGIQRQAQAQSAGLKYQAQLDEVNAVNADRAARDALERGELDAVAHGRQVRELRGRQIAAQASENLELGFGSPLAILQDTDLLAAEDRATIYENANREAEGYRISASNARASAAGNMAQRSNVKTAAILDSASTVLNTATQLGGQWAKYGKRN
jgi:hypothetical protein